MSRERERGREMKREREMGKRGGREKERESGGEGRVMYTFCALFATMFPEKGGGSSDETNSGMETVEIQIKTIQ